MCITVEYIASCDIDMLYESMSVLKYFHKKDTTN